MKTIADAHRELKGDLGNSRSPDSTDNFLFFDIKGEYYIGHEDRGFFSDTYAKYICTVDEFNNYKPVKTVLDAVIEFKGEFDYTDLSADHPDTYQVIVAVSDFDEYKCGDITTGASVSDNQFWKVICTRDEFNTLVDELTSNMGTFGLSYEEYKKEHESMLEPLETPLDDNSLQYKISNLGNVLHNMSCSMDDEDEQNQFGGYASFLWDLSQNYAAVTIGKTENSKPVYTQVMCDSGALPSVGMECEWKCHNTNVTLTFIGDEMFCGINDTGKEAAGYISDLKPLTPPIQLIDGGRYEFELCFGDYRLGYWKEDRNSFFDSLLCANKVCGKSEASNIKLLTVEGEL